MSTKPTHSSSNDMRRRHAKDNILISQKQEDGLSTVTLKPLPAFLIGEEEINPFSHNDERPKLLLRAPPKVDLFGDAAETGVILQFSPSKSCKVNRLLSNRSREKENTQFTGFLPPISSKSSSSSIVSRNKGESSSGFSKTVYSSGNPSAPDVLTGTRTTHSQPSAIATGQFAHKMGFFISPSDRSRGTEPGRMGRPQSQSQTQIRMQTPTQSKIQSRFQNQNNAKSHQQLQHGKLNDDSNSPVLSSLTTSPTTSTALAGFPQPHRLFGAGIEVFHNDSLGFELTGGRDATNFTRYAMERYEGTLCRHRRLIESHRIWQRVLHELFEMKKQSIRLNLLKDKDKDKDKEKDKKKGNEKDIEKDFSRSDLKENATLKDISTAIPTSTASVDVQVQIDSSVRERVPVKDILAQTSLQNGVLISRFGYLNTISSMEARRDTNISKAHLGERNLQNRESNANASLLRTRRQILLSILKSHMVFASPSPITTDLKTKPSPMLPNTSTKPRTELHMDTNGILEPTTSINIDVVPSEAVGNDTVASSSAILPSDIGISFNYLSNNGTNVTNNLSHMNTYSNTQNEVGFALKQLKNDESTTTAEAGTVVGLSSFLSSTTLTSNLVLPNTLTPSLPSSPSSPSPSPPPSPSFSSSFGERLVPEESPDGCSDDVLGPMLSPEFALDIDDSSDSTNSLNSSTASLFAIPLSVFESPTHTKGRKKLWSPQDSSNSFSSSKKSSIRNSGKKKFQSPFKSGAIFSSRVEGCGMTMGNSLYPPVKTPSSGLNSMSTVRSPHPSVSFAIMSSFASMSPISTPMARTTQILTSPVNSPLRFQGKKQRASMWNFSSSPHRGPNVPQSRHICDDDGNTDDNNNNNNDHIKDNNDNSDNDNDINDNRVNTKHRDRQVVIAETKKKNISSPDSSSNSSPSHGGLSPETRIARRYLDAYRYSLQRIKMLTPKKLAHKRVENDQQRERVVGDVESYLHDLNAFPSDYIADVTRRRVLTKTPTKMDGVAHFEATLSQTTPKSTSTLVKERTQTRQKNSLEPTFVPVPVHKIEFTSIGFGSNPTTREDMTNSGNTVSNFDCIDEVNTINDIKVSSERSTNTTFDEKQEENNFLTSLSSISSTNTLDLPLLPLPQISTETKAQFKEDKTGNQSQLDQNSISVFSSNHSETIQRAVVPVNTGLGEYKATLKDHHSNPPFTSFYSTSDFDSSKGNVLGKFENSSNFGSGIQSEFGYTTSESEPSFLSQELSGALISNNVPSTTIFHAKSSFESSSSSFTLSANLPVPTVAIHTLEKVFGADEVMEKIELNENDLDLSSVSRRLDFDSGSGSSSDDNNSHENRRSEGKNDNIDTNHAGTIIVHSNHHSQLEVSSSPKPIPSSYLSNDKHEPKRKSPDPHEKLRRRPALLPSASFSEKKDSSTVERTYTNTLFSTHCPGSNLFSTSTTSHSTSSTPNPAMLPPATLSVSLPQIHSSSYPRPEKEETKTTTQSLYPPSTTVFSEYTEDDVLADIVTLPEVRQLVEMVGLPATLRAKAWFKWSGAELKMRAVDEYHTANPSAVRKDPAGIYENTKNLTYEQLLLRPLYSRELGCLIAATGEPVRAPPIPSLISPLASSRPISSRTSSRYKGHCEIPGIFDIPEGVDFNDEVEINKVRITRYALSLRQTLDNTTTDCSTNIINNTIATSLLPPCANVFLSSSETYDVAFRTLDQIDRDVTRTTCHHPYLHTASSHNVLTRVLSAYAYRNPTLGYLQSMNFLVALLLVVLGEDAEVEAFWVLAALVEDIFPEHYSENMVGLQSLMATFNALVGEEQPTVAATLRKAQTDVSLRSVSWFLCLFFTYLPAETVAGLWDVLFMHCFIAAHETEERKEQLLERRAEQVVELRKHKRWVRRYENARRLALKKAVSKGLVRSRTEDDEDNDRNDIENKNSLREALYDDDGFEIIQSSDPLGVRISTISSSPFSSNKMPIEKQKRPQEHENKKDKDSAASHLPRVSMYMPEGRTRIYSTAGAVAPTVNSIDIDCQEKNKKNGNSIRAKTKTVSEKGAEEDKDDVAELQSMVNETYFSSASPDKQKERKVLAGQVLSSSSYFNAGSFTTTPMESTGESQELYQTQSPSQLSISLDLTNFATKNAKKEKKDDEQSLQPSRILAFDPSCDSDYDSDFGSDNDSNNGSDGSESDIDAPVDPSTVLDAQTLLAHDEEDSRIAEMERQIRYARVCSVLCCQALGLLSLLEPRMRTVGTNTLAMIGILQNAGTFVSDAHVLMQRAFLQHSITDVAFFILRTNLLEKTRLEQEKARLEIEQRRKTQVQARMSISANIGTNVGALRDRDRKNKTPSRSSILMNTKIGCENVKFGIIKGKTKPNLNSSTQSREKETGFSSPISSTLSSARTSPVPPRRLTLSQSQAPIRTRPSVRLSFRGTGIGVVPKKYPTNSGGNLNYNHHSHRGSQSTFHSSTAQTNRVWEIRNQFKQFVTQPGLFDSMDSLAGSITVATSPRPSLSTSMRTTDSTREHMIERDDNDGEENSECTSDDDYDHGFTKENNHNHRLLRETRIKRIGNSLSSPRSPVSPRPLRFLTSPVATMKSFFSPKKNEREGNNQSMYIRAHTQAGIFNPSISSLRGNSQQSHLHLQTPMQTPIPLQNHGVFIENNKLADVSGSGKLPTSRSVSSSSAFASNSIRKAKSSSISISSAIPLSTPPRARKPTGGSKELEHKDHGDDSFQSQVSLHASPRQQRRKRAESSSTIHASQMPQYTAGYTHITDMSTTTMLSLSPRKPRKSFQVLSPRPSPPQPAFIASVQRRYQKRQQGSTSPFTRPRQSFSAADSVMDISSSQTYQ